MKNAVLNVLLLDIITTQKKQFFDIVINRIDCDFCEFLSTRFTVWLCTMTFSDAAVIIVR